MWPLSPLKKKAATKPSILDMDFPDDEDDDEYNPENDMEVSGPLERISFSFVYFSIYSCQTQVIYLV